MTDGRTDGQIENGDFIELPVRRGSNITKKDPGVAWYITDHMN